MQTSNLSTLFSVYSFVSAGMLITDGVIGDIKGNACNSCGFSTVLCTLAHAEFFCFLALVLWCMVLFSATLVCRVQYPMGAYMHCPG